MNLRFSLHFPAGHSFSSAGLKTQITHTLNFPPALVPVSAVFRQLSFILSACCSLTLGEAKTTHMTGKLVGRAVQECSPFLGWRYGSVVKNHILNGEGES